MSLAGEDRAFGDGGDVADEHLAEAGGERGSVVANLVGVGKNYIVRAFELDQLLQSARIIRRPCRERAAGARRG